MGIPIFIINLDRRPDRMVVMERRLSGISFNRVSAVDGCCLDESDCLNEVPPNAVYPLSSNEVACIRSHRLIAQNIVDENLPFACVLEDDVLLSSEFGAFISDDSWIPEHAGIIKIETMLEPVWIARKKQHAHARGLHELRSAHPGTAGYIISYSGAVRMLELLSCPDRAADDLMFDYARKKGSLGQILQMSPALCAQEFVCSETGSLSDILSSREELRTPLRVKPRGGQKLLRELKRPFQQAWEKRRYIREVKRIIPFD